MKEGLPRSHAPRVLDEAELVLKRADQSERLDWLDERDARVRPPPDPPVWLVTVSGKRVGCTRESNAERMAAALEPRQGPLTVVPD